MGKKRERTPAAEHGRGVRHCELTSTVQRSKRGGENGRGKGEHRNKGSKRRTRKWRGGMGVVGVEGSESLAVIKRRPKELCIRIRAKEKRKVNKELIGGRTH